MSTGYMNSFSVWVKLKDIQYANHLIAFLRNRYGQEMRVFSVGEADLKSEGKGILLTDEPTESTEYGKVVLITEKEGINPYQSAGQIAREILARWEEEKGYIEPKQLEEKAKGRFISIYSPIGGIGKSTLAMGMAEILAQKGKRVLLLTLEGPSAWPLFFEYPKAYNLSDFFYCFLLESKQERGKRMESMLCKQKNDIFFLPSCFYIDDFLELTGKELNEWMEELRCGFDFILVDLGSQMIRPLRQILENSEECCYLVDPRPAGQCKWQDFRVECRPDGREWIFKRHEDKARGGEILLPEEPSLFELSEGRRSFRKNSAYYLRLKNVVDELI